MVGQKVRSVAKSISSGGLDGKELEVVAVPIKSKKRSKKRTASGIDRADKANLVDNGVDHGEQINGSEIEDDLDEPTMGDKLVSLTLLDDDDRKRLEKESSGNTNPPSADSVHVLLKQALHANDQALILNCLYTQDKKVIANSVSLLNTSDVLKLLDSLITLIQSRGKVLVCALPWLRSLLMWHASGIMSQESSLLALNSLYQLIESRVSTFETALQLSSCLDLLYQGSIDDDLDENGTVTPIVYEDKDESEEDELEDAMETDEEGDDPEALDGITDNYGSDASL